MPDKKNYFSSDFTLGILGGGQLGKMLLSETRRYDIRTKVLDPSASAPGRIASNEFQQGSFQDEGTVLEFAKDCDLLTFEIESVSLPALQKLEEAGKPVYPRPETLAIIQDKTTQKLFYRENRIPTSPFFVYEGCNELQQLLEEGKLSFPFVWKAPTGGYDGRGVKVVKYPEDLDELPDAKGLAEEFIPFEKELAIIVARSARGEIKTYPLVEMEFHPEANLVEYVFCPADVSEKISSRANKLAAEIVEKMNHVGILAIEMFLTLQDELLINEMAPRVHNSGHLSIEGNVTSQFEQHLRAIMNLPLGDTALVRPSVMINLNGEDGFSGPVYYEGIEEVMSLPGVYVHLYGKAETRPFRKMGHITITAEHPETARKLARKVREIIKVKSI